MSLLAKVEQLLAEEADGLVKAVKHLAAAVEKPIGVSSDLATVEIDLRAAADSKLAGIEADLRGVFVGMVQAFLAEAKAGVDAKLAELEGQVSAALAKLQPPTAAAPAEPVQSPQPVQEQAPQPAA